GALIVVALRKRSALPTLVAQVAGLLGLALIAVGALTISASQPYPGTAVLLPVIGATLLIIAGGSRSSWVSMGLATRPFVWIGDLSYGWYLFHWPAIVFVGLLLPGQPWLLLVAGIATVLPAWLSRRYIEDPIRRAKHLRGARTLAVGAVSVGVPAAVCFFMLMGAQNYWWDPSIRTMAQQLQAPFGDVNCPSTLANPAIGSTGLRVCSWPGSGVPVYLIGDSQAGQFTDPVRLAGQALNRPVFEAGNGGCPLAQVWVEERGADRPDCREYVAWVTDWLTHQPPGLVFVATSWDLYVESEFTTLRATPDGVAPDGPASRSAFLATQVSQILTPLVRAGHDVRLIQTIPHFLGWWPKNCPNALLLNSTSSCGTSVPLSEANSGRQYTLQLESAIAAATGVKVFPLDNTLCRDGICATNSGDEWKYRDALHITERQSVALTPQFTKELGR
ncbi:MAG: acyltransferase family protein, partial [Actinomycetes bacterium]